MSALEMKLIPSHSEGDYHSKYTALKKLAYRNVSWLTAEHGACLAGLLILQGIFTFLTAITVSEAKGAQAHRKSFVWINVGVFCASSLGSLFLHNRAIHNARKTAKAVSELHESFSFEEEV